jgi:hypothetical protein
MSNKKLTILGTLAVLMVIWAVIQARLASNRQKAEPSGPTYLIQGLDPTDIASIVIGAPNSTFTLNRTDNGFVIAERDNFPALPEKINKLITTCLEIKTPELRTDDAANHEELGVTEETAGSFVKFLRADSSLLTGAIVGKKGPRPPSAYVRLATSDKVYLVERSPWIQTRPVDYVDPEIVAVDREDVESVSVTSPEGEYTIAADETGKGIVFKNIPPGKRLKGSNHELAFDALWDLTFDDVYRVGKKNLNFDRRFICRLKDSTVFALEIARLDGRTYITCQADFTDEIPAMKENLSEELLKEREAKLPGRARAKEFTAKHAGWVYRLYEYKAARLLYNLSDLLEDEE